MSAETELLKVIGLRKQYKLPKKDLFKKAEIIYPVNDVSLSIHNQQNLGIAGESGSGKSTLARLLAQLEIQNAGDVYFNGKNIRNFNKKEHQKFRKSVQFIFQDPYESLNPKRNIFQILAEPLVIHTKLAKHQLSKKVDTMLYDVGLSIDIQDKYAHQLSGGQRQRVAIARSLMLEPKLVIADEPVSALDVSVQAQILNLLLKLQKKLGITYIVISHDIAVLRHLCDNIIIYYAGKIVEKQGVDNIFEAKENLHPYTTALMKASFFDEFPEIVKPNFDTVDGYNLLQRKFSGCAFYPRCPTRLDVCAKEDPSLKKFQLGKLACHNPGKMLKL